MSSKEPTTGWRATVWRYAPLVVWIGVIFFLSSDQGSLSSTSRFVRPILVFFFPNAPEATLLVYHGYVRKMAHFTEYFVLGALAARTFSAIFPNAGVKWAVPAVLTVAAVASIDEINQSFSARRTGSPYDVLIDVAGGACAVALAWVLMRRRTRMG